MNHDCLCIMPCLCVVCLPCCLLYLVVCFFPVMLLPDSSCFVATMRIRSTTLGSYFPVHLLHGLVLLPCGISGKMTATLDLTTIIAMLVASFYRYAVLPITCLSSHPILPCQPLTFSSSWTCSSSLRDFRQDDRYPGSHYYHCYASCFVLSLCCATYHLFIKPSHIAMSASNLFHPS